MMDTHAIVAESDARAGIRRMLGDARLLAVTLCGAAGAGKTTLLEQTLRRLGGRYRAGVIVANPKADRDAQRLDRYAETVVAVRTAVLEAAQLHDVIARTSLDELDVLFVEMVARFTNPSSIELGQGARVAVFSVSGGDDKAAEFPHGVADADLILLNKLDLLPHVCFDPRVFESDVRRLNLDAPVLHVSAARGTGMDQWESWLVDQVRRIPRAPAAEWPEPPEVFLG